MFVLIGMVNHPVFYSIGSRPRKWSIGLKLRFFFFFCRFSVAQAIEWIEPCALYLRLTQLAYYWYNAFVDFWRIHPKRDDKFSLFCPPPRGVFYSAFSAAIFIL